MKNEGKNIVETNKDNAIIKSSFDYTQEEFDDEQDFWEDYVESA